MYLYDFKQLVGEQIRKTRKLKGMTQERLAERSGLSFSYISDVERGTRNISLESLGKIIVALGIKPTHLFEDADDAGEELDDGTRIKIESLNALLIDRDVEEVDFILKMAQEFTHTVDRKKR